MTLFLAAGATAVPRAGLQVPPASRLASFISWYWASVRSRRLRLAGEFGAQVAEFLLEPPIFFVRFGESAAQRDEFGEVVEHEQMQFAPEQGLVFVLAVQVNQAVAKSLQGPRRWSHGH